MTDSCEIDVEVGGSIVISNTEETVIDSRGASIAEEESAEENTNRRHALKRFAVWNIFKSIVFLLCLIVFIIQSVEFLTDYYKYPTKIETEITVYKEMKLPAITFCFRNTISFKEFCFYEPEWCESLNNSNKEEFCENYPFHCKGDTSNLTVPVRDYQTRRILQRFLFNDSYNDDEYLFQVHEYHSTTRTFIRDLENRYYYLKCYSENLHLFQSRWNPIAWKFKFDRQEGDLVMRAVLRQTNIEPFYRKDYPQVFLAIHSPYLPIDVKDLHAIMPYTRYNIDVQLEKEEHLLLSPYQTNCRDNRPSKDAKEFTNPNSHEMCLEMCRSEYNKASSGCGYGMTMVLSERHMCSGDYERPNLSPEQKYELWDKQLVCFQNCKQGCLKLQYKYRIKEIDLKYKGFEKSESIIDFYVKNPEVTVLRHVPLYGTGDIFSHIGGLLGCWLGVSVFTFTDILEKFFRKIARWKKKFRKRREQRVPLTSETHQD